MHQNMTQTMLVAHLVAHMLRGTEQFADSVVGLPVPFTPTCLNDDRANWANSAMQEEIIEFLEATQKGDVAEAADALIDLVYFALGRLVEMGVPALAVFDAVQQANMTKVRGELSKRPGAQGFDATKPVGWQAPNHAWLVELSPETITKATKWDRLSPETIAKATKWDRLSPVFQQIYDLRIAKGEDYNNVPGGRDAYFPFGHTSYVHMLSTKVLRLQSLVRAMDDGRTPNFEGIIDTARDLVNYGTYYAEAMMDGRLSMKSSTAAPLSLATAAGSDA